MKFLGFWVSLFCILNAQDLASIENTILHFQFSKADSLIQKISASPLQVYYQHHNLFYQQLFCERYTFEEFLQKSDLLVKKVLQNKIEERWKIAILGELYFERAAASFAYKHYWNAYQNFRTAYQWNQKATQYPHFEFPKRLTATFEILLGSIPSQYQWIANWLGYSGNLEHGTQLLLSIMNKTEIQKEENQLLYFYLSKHLLNDPSQSFNIILRLHQKSPQNVFYAYLLGISYMDKKKLALAKQSLWNGWKCPIQNFEYPLYHLAHCYLYELKLDSALYCFEKFVELKKGDLFKADAYYKMGVIYSLQNQPYDAQKYFYRATQYHNAISDKDLHAIKISKNFIFKPLSKEELLLYQARWLFDGGNYSKALSVLGPLEAHHNPNIKIEATYRKARIYHELKDYARAIEHYKAVLSLPATQNIWMKPYSAYFLALIFEEKNDNAKAIHYLNYALGYKNYDFQASLEQKVKTELSKIKKKK